jgi:hypothetical protein
VKSPEVDSEVNRKDDFEGGFEELEVTIEPRDASKSKLRLTNDRSAP